MARLVLSVLFFLFTFSAFAANEETITFTSADQNVFGTLALPEGGPAPVVLMLHGFTGARDELKTDHVKAGVFARTARRLAEQGYASLRIDFRGSGESVDDLSFAQTTFDSQIADALAAVAYLKSSEQVQSDEIYLIGWSQGGLVATAVAGRSKDLDVVALWAAVADPKLTYGALLGPEVMKMGKAAGANEAVKVKLPWGAEIELNGTFFEGIESFDAIAEIAAFKGPLFVAQGIKDTTVVPESADKLIAAHEGPEQLWKADMGHVFNTFTTEKTLDELIDVTISFFKKHDD